MFNGDTLRDAIISAANNLTNNRKQIDDLNVFPVPDGDTGTNMSMTLANSVRELEKLSGATAGKVASVNASALLRGARGNSGVITSLLFRGFAKGIGESEFATTCSRTSFSASCRCCVCKYAQDSSPIANAETKNRENIRFFIKINQTFYVI